MPDLARGPCVVNAWLKLFNSTGSIGKRRYFHYKESPVTIQGRGFNSHSRLKCRRYHSHSRFDYRIQVRLIFKYRVIIQFIQKRNAESVTRILQCWEPLTHGNTGRRMSNHYCRRIFWAKTKFARNEEIFGWGFININDWLPHFTSAKTFYANGEEDSEIILNSETRSVKLGYNRTKLTYEDFLKFFNTVKLGYNEVYGTIHICSL